MLYDLRNGPWANDQNVRLSTTPQILKALDSTTITKQRSNHQAPNWKLWLPDRWKSNTYQTFSILRRTETALIAPSGNCWAFSISFLTSPTGPKRYKKDTQKLWISLPFSFFPFSPLSSLLSSKRWDSLFCHFRLFLSRPYSLDWLLLHRSTKRLGDFQWVHTQTQRTPGLKLDALKTRSLVHLALTFYFFSRPLIVPRISWTSLNGSTSSLLLPTKVSHRLELFLQDTPPVNSSGVGKSRADYSRHFPLLLLPLSRSNEWIGSICLGFRCPR